MHTKQERFFSTELAYALGILLLAIGTALMERADFGVSMVVAPAYLLYRKLSPMFSFVSFGMAEYLLQALLLIIMSLALRKFRRSDLFSFVTAVIYGLVLDGCMALAALLPATFFWARATWYVLGLVSCAVGVAMMLSTYIAPEVYELFVRRLVEEKGWNTARVKTTYDLTSCLVAVVMSFAFFGWGHFEGVKWGTVLCTLVNGALIGAIKKALDRRFTFRDRLPLRRYFNA